MRVRAGAEESTLASLKHEIVGKQQEMEDANEIIASLEDHLGDLKLKAVSKSSSGEDTIDQDESGSAPKATVEEQIKKDEPYWRKRFADAHYLVHMAEKELDALQRELSTLCNTTPTLTKLSVSSTLGAKSTLKDRK
jgi:hypothetical protein